MSLRFLLIPAAVLAALACASAEVAVAHPLGARTVAPNGPRFHVSGRIGIPPGFQGGRYETVVRWVGGYYETRTREVEVPGRLIGYDRRGRPIYGEPRIEIETYKVWVPRRKIVERVWVPNRRPLYLRPWRHHRHHGHHRHPRHHRDRHHGHAYQQDHRGPNGEWRDGPRGDRAAPAPDGRGPRGDGRGPRGDRRGFDDPFDAGRDGRIR